MHTHRLVAYLVLLTMLGMATLLPSGAPEARAQDGLLAQQEDAGWIAFSHPDPTQRGIWLVRPDGAELHQLTRGWDFFPTWSPDGTRVAYLHMEQVSGNDPFTSDLLKNGRSSVKVVDLQGQLLWTLSASQWAQGESSWSSAGLCWAPVWSPDGQALAYMSTPVSGLWSSITIFHIASPPTLEQKSASVTDLVWTPGRELTWVKFSQDTMGSVLMVGDQPRLTAKGIIANPRPSPSGQELSFASLDLNSSSSDSRLTLERMAIDGTNRRTLLRVSEKDSPRGESVDGGFVAHWDPQGKRYLVGVPYNYISMVLGMGMIASWNAPPSGFLFILDSEGKKQAISTPQYGTLDLISDQPWNDSGTQVTFLRSSVNTQGLPLYQGNVTPSPSPTPVGVFDPETVGIYAGLPGQTKRIVPLSASLTPNRLLFAIPAWQPHTTADTTPAPPAPSNAPRLAYIGEDGNAWVMRADGTDRRQLTTDGSPLPTDHDINPTPSSWVGYSVGAWAPDATLLALKKSQVSGCNQLVIIDTQTAQGIASIPITACPTIVWEQNSTYLTIRYSGEDTTSRVNVRTGVIDPPRSLLPQITTQEWQSERIEQSQPCEHVRYTNTQNGQILELLPACILRVGTGSMARDLPLTMPKATYYQRDGSIDPNVQIAFSNISLAEVHGGWTLWNGSLVGGMASDSLNMLVNIETGAHDGSLGGSVHDFSPDGRYIFTTSAYKIWTPHEIAVIDLANQFASRTLAVGDRQSMRWAPAPTPQGEIAYVDGGDIYLLNLTTGDKQRLTNGADVYPWLGGITWSPDGKRIVFTSQSDLYQITIDGTIPAQPIRLTDQRATYFSPTFAPDGTFFFVRHANGYDVLRVKNLNAGIQNPEVVYALEKGQSVSGIRAISNTLLVIPLDNNDLTHKPIQFVDLSTKQLISRTVADYLPEQRVCNGTHYSHSRISGGNWSSRSGHLAAYLAVICADSQAASTLLYPADIALLSADGTFWKLLDLDSHWNWNSSNSELEWSPDGQWLVFDQTPPPNGQKAEIWTINVDSGQLLKLVEGTSPAWRPITKTEPPPATSTVTIRGKVTDGHGNPLVGVVVRLTDPSGQLVTAKKPDGTTVDVRTTSSDSGVYTLSAAITSGDYRVDVRLQDANGRKRVLFGPSQIEVSAAAAISIKPDQNKYTLPIDFGDSQHLISPLPAGDNDKLDDLAGIYFHTWEADNFITTTLPHPKYQAVGNVWAFSGAVQTAYYALNNHPNLKPPVSGEQGVILITDSQSVFGHVYMNVEWHESFHHLMWRVLRDAMNAGPDYGSSHGGFANPSTRASWVEGWAEFWPCVMRQSPQYQIDDKDWVFKGKVLVSGSVSIEQNWQAWDYSGMTPREEFAVAGVLWDLYDGTDESGDSIQLPVSSIWSILTQSNPITITNVSELYRVLTKVETRRAHQLRIDQLNSIFISHGFYAETVWELPGNGIYVLLGKYRRYNGEEVGWGGRWLPENKPRPNVEPVPSAYLKVNLAESTISNTTITVTLDFDQPYYDYSYTIKAPGPSAMIYVEPPPTRTLALVTVTASNGTQTSQPFTIDNQTYWQRVAESTTGYAAETTLTLAVHPPEVPIAGLRAVLSAVVIAGESAALAATADAGSAVTYAWDFGDGTSGKGALVTHSYPTAGDYTVTITASNALSTVTQQVAVTVHAAAPVIEPTAANSDRADESGSPNATTQTDGVPRALTPVVTLLPPAVQPYWLAIGGGGAVLLLLIVGSVLWRGRTRRSRLPVAQVEPVPPAVAKPSAPPAADLLQSLLASAPTPLPARPADMPQALAAIGRDDLVAGKAMLLEITTREPTNAEAWLSLGIIATRQRDWVGARRCGLAAYHFGHPQADNFLIWLHQRETSGK